MPKQQTAQPAETAALIAAYRNTARRLARVKRLTSLAIVLLVLAFAVLLYRKITHFRDHEVTRFSAALAQNISGMAPQVSEDLSAMVNRVSPHCITAVQNTIARRGPAVRRRLETEMQLLDAYAQERWPAIEKALLDLALAQERVIQEEFAAVIGATEAESIGHAYAYVLMDKYEDLLAGAFKEHAEAASSVGDSLSRMMELEHDIGKPIDMNYALGVLLELAGLELQKGM